MIFNGKFIFQVLPFNPLLAASTETTIEFVIMVLAIWFVVENIELSGRKWLGACCADEASLVVLATQSSICR
jgi:hypothetical protein